MQCVSFSQACVVFGVATKISGAPFAAQLLAGLVDIFVMYETVGEKCKAVARIVRDWALGLVAYLVVAILAGS